MEKLIKSKERVKKYAEVFTPEWLVKRMCDLLVENGDKDPYAIETTFLEPACGTGNFLVEIYARKLEHCESEKDGLKALASIVGIDILPDNCAESRTRLKTMFLDKFPTASEFALTMADMILKNNIICGNSLEIMKQWQVENESNKST